MNDQDQIRLTAYALGELDEGERAEVEQMLRHSLEARQVVDDARRIGRLLEQGLAADDDAEEALTANQRRQVRTVWWLETYGRPQGFVRRIMGGRAALGMAVAASVLVVAGTLWMADWGQWTDADGDGVPGGAATRLDSTQQAGRPPEGWRMPSSNGQDSAFALLNDGQSFPHHYYEALNGIPFVVPGTNNVVFLGTEEQRAQIEQMLASLDVSEVEQGSRGNANRYAPVLHNPLLRPSEYPLSTFAIDVDTASYANLRRYLNEGQLPPAGAVRVEEMVNYFTYSYPQPGEADEDSADTINSPENPFTVNVDVAECPWRLDNLLMRIGIQGKDVPPQARPSANLVFLIDVSGSMEDPRKLPLVRKSLEMLSGELFADDRVAIVVYAGDSRVVLPPTAGNNSAAILDALAQLEAGGSTNGGEGIDLAYDLAREDYIDGGVNRVILATDGDFNVGITEQDELVRLVREKADAGIFLTVLGYGFGDLHDATLEKLADSGDGNYAYIDSPREAEKVLVEQVGGTLVTIAKDVKVQVEFNPATVQAYRLIGYENRVLGARDFNDDTVDAGEIGAGHSVTALYEIVPAGVAMPEYAALKGARGDSRTSDGTSVGASGGARASGAGDAMASRGPDLARPPLAREPQLARGGAREDSRTGEAESGEQADTLAGLANDPDVDPLKYQTLGNLAAAVGAGSDELATVKLRYKEPDGSVTRLIETAVRDRGVTLDGASDDFRFAAAVASAGMVLRGSPYVEGWTLNAATELAKPALGADRDGRRAGFVDLMHTAIELSGAVRQ